MAITDIAQRAAPIVESALEDSDFRERVQAAGIAGRSAVIKARKGKPKRTVLQRAGEAVREAGAAVVALSNVSDPKPKRSKASSLLRLTLIGGVAAGAALAVRSRANQPQPADHA